EPSRRGGNGEGDRPRQSCRGARAHGANRRVGAEPAWPLRGALANTLLGGAGSNHRRDCARGSAAWSRFPVQDGGGLVSPADLLEGEEPSDPAGALGRT